MPARSLRAAALIVLLSHAGAGAQPPAPVKTVEFESKSVGRTMKYNVVLPEGYDSADERYPVLYLLHGLSGNYTNWARMRVPEYARAYKLIVVMPDGGNSWYVNWARSEEGQKNDWEDGIVKDLIAHVDASFRTVARREGRAINGLSMGGYGALMLGLRHPDLFCAAGSHSGALSLARRSAERLRSGEGPLAKKEGSRTPSKEPNPAIGIAGFSSQVERSPKGRPFETAEQADAYDPFKLVAGLPKEKLPHLYVDCGTEDRLLAANRDFAGLLREKKIPFVYAEAPGAHNGAYWSRQVGQSMAIQYHALRRAIAAAENKPSSADAAR